MAPELDTALQVRSHQSRVEGQNYLPRPVVHASLDAVQDTVGFLGCERTLLGHVELLIHQYPQVLLLRAALNPFSAQSVFVVAIAPTQVQDLALGIVELHETHTGPMLKPVRMVSLPSSRSTTWPSWVSLANLLRECSIPLSMSPTKMLHSTSPNTDPWGTPFITGLHLDIKLLTATLWV